MFILTMIMMNREVTVKKGNSDERSDGIYFKILLLNWRYMELFWNNTVFSGEILNILYTYQNYKGFWVLSEKTYLSKDLYANEL